MQRNVRQCLHAGAVPTVGLQAGSAADDEALERGAPASFDPLDRLRIGLISSAILRRDLEQILEMVGCQRERADDPLLTAMLDEFELRARLELAKYGQ